MRVSTCSQKFSTFKNQFFGYQYKIEIILKTLFLNVRKFTESPKPVVILKVDAIASYNTSHEVGNLATMRVGRVSYELHGSKCGIRRNYYFLRIEYLSHSCSVSIFGEKVSS